MVSALLGPARIREANVSVPFELRVMSLVTASFARQAGWPAPSPPGGAAGFAIMHIRLSLITADPRVLAGRIGIPGGRSPPAAGEPVRQPAAVAAAERRARRAIFESFWATGR
jgi:hypothetical protein